MKKYKYDGIYGQSFRRGDSSNVNVMVSLYLITMGMFAGFLLGVLSSLFWLS